MTEQNGSTSDRPAAAVHEDEILKRLVEGWWDRPGVFTAVLAALGDAYSRSGEYDKALACDRILAKRLSDDPAVWYNLACSLSRTGETVKALAALKMAVACGYRDWRHLMSDEDLEALRQMDDFQRWWRSRHEKDVDRTDEGHRQEGSWGKT